MTLTCHDHEIQAMAWKVDPYIPVHNPIIYVSGQLIATGSHPVHHRGAFVATLTNLTRSGDDIHVADLTSELIFTTSGVDNNTRITCQTNVGSQQEKMTITFYHAGINIGV